MKGTACGRLEVTSMQLRDSTLERLAEMVAGDNGFFPYRRGFELTTFFARCGYPDFVHDGYTRRLWTLDRLKEVNAEPGTSETLPSAGLLRVIRELFDVDDFDTAPRDREQARVQFNQMMQRYELVLEFQGVECRLRHRPSGVNWSGKPCPPLTPQELARREAIVDFLNRSSEDEFTERLLLPLFQSLGFVRVSVAGHTEKALEYGKDLWMKCQLPTGHWLYFCAQIKLEKLNSRGSSGNTNIATVLNQVNMALGHPLFDPEVNRKVLLDHVFIISAREITRAGKNWLVEQLDLSQRRTIIFMDRTEIVELVARQPEALFKLSSQPEPRAS